MPLLLVLLVAAVFVAKFAWLLAAVLVVTAAGTTIGKVLARRDDRATVRRLRGAAICARADRQHAAVLAGDYYLGVYGSYPPAI